MEQAVFMFILSVIQSPASSQDSNQDLQILIHNLNRKVGESEEKYSLLREQTESLKALLNKEKSQFQEKEAMYTENVSDLFRLFTCVHYTYTLLKWTYR